MTCLLALQRPEVALRHRGLARHAADVAIVAGRPHSGYLKVGPHKPVAASLRLRLALGHTNQPHAGFLSLNHSDHRPRRNMPARNWSRLPQGSGILWLAIPQGSRAPNLVQSDFAAS